MLCKHLEKVRASGVNNMSTIELSLGTLGLDFSKIFDETKSTHTNRFVGDIKKYV